MPDLHPDHRWIDRKVLIGLAGLASLPLIPLAIWALCRLGMEVKAILGT